MQMIKKILDWFVAAKQQPEVPTPNVRQTALYIGLQLEELAEKLESVLGNGATVVMTLHETSGAFKKGLLDNMVNHALHNHAEHLLDADVDLLWVTLGGARAQGADVISALTTLITANYDKFVDGQPILDENGKVKKPEGWLPPNMHQHIHSSLKEQR